MRLADVDGELFGKLVHWLYTKQIEEHLLEVDSLVPMAKFWSLAERFEVVELQNAIMDCMVLFLKKCEGGSLGEFLKFAYAEGGKVDSALKRLAVDKLCWDVELEVLKVMREEGSVPAEVWGDVAMAFSKHYWDGIPGKYFKKWVGEGEYAVLRDEEGEEMS